jgi:crotonobetainyl-CoA:carnitine CoA-transferase CaiB-like acyl-CoA transferase
MEFPRKDRRKAKIPLWNHYQCGDGEWLILGMLQSDRYWSRFCRIMGIPELENDPRFHSHARRQENCQELIQILDKIFLTKPREEWLRLLRQEPDFIVSIINRISDLPHDPQVVANEYITELNHPRLGPTKFLGVPVHFSKTPGAVRLPAPEFGQHTDEVLRDICGYSPEEIEELRREEVIA